MLLSQSAGLWMSVQRFEQQHYRFGLDRLVVISEPLWRPHGSQKPNLSSRSIRTNDAGLYVRLGGVLHHGYIFSKSSAPTAKVARTDAIAAGADDTSWDSSCGATP